MCVFTIKQPISYCQMTSFPKIIPAFSKGAFESLVTIVKSFYILNHYVIKQPKK